MNKKHYSFRSVIAPIIHRYLNIRYSLGRKCRSDNIVLKNLDSFLYSKNQDLTFKSFKDWCHTKENISAISQRIRMLIVRKLCLYRRRTEYKCFIPDINQFPRSKSNQRIEPHIFSKDEIICLSDVIKTIKPHYYSPLRQENYKLSLVLLYTTGLRCSELCKLTIGDYNSTEHSLLIKETKFHKSRIIPLSQDGWKELEKYLKIRHNHLLPISEDSSIIWNNSWNRYKTNGFYNSSSCSNIFKTLFNMANIKTTKGFIPRMHDFRHTFAVHTLQRWYHENIDVQSKLPLLSTYMGHVSIESTKYYLKFIENIADMANNRFEKHYSKVIVQHFNKRGKTWGKS
jgi:integrase/recombinase XerD